MGQEHRCLSGALSDGDDVGFFLLAMSGDLCSCGDDGGFVLLWRRRRVGTAGDTARVFVLCRRRRGEIRVVGDGGGFVCLPGEACRADRGGRDRTPVRRRLDQVMVLQCIASSLVMHCGAIAKEGRCTAAPSPPPQRCTVASRRRRQCITTQIGEDVL